MARAGKSYSRGFSLLELVVALGLSAALMGISILNFRNLDDQSENGALLLASFFKQIRARAISTTSAYIIEPESETRVVAYYGVNCSSSDLETEGSFALELPTGSELSSTEWSVCFTSRGLTSSSDEIEIVNLNGGSQTIEVYLGGAVRVQ